MAAEAGRAQISLTAFGQKITLKHRADDPAVVTEAVAIVEKGLRTALDRVPKGAAPHHVALVALLDLAAEYVQARSRTEAFKQDLEKKAAELEAGLHACQAP